MDQDEISPLVIHISMTVIFRSKNVAFRLCWYKARCTLFHRSVITVTIVGIGTDRHVQVV